MVPKVVEDCDLSILDFEGDIPAGEYGAGAGSIVIWDNGTYEMVSEHEGRLKLHFSGNKMVGNYVLTSLSGRNRLMCKVKEQRVIERNESLL